jgi:hypothetical protein
MPMMGEKMAASPNSPADVNPNSLFNFARQISGRLNSIEEQLDSISRNLGRDGSPSVGCNVEDKEPVTLQEWLDAALALVTSIDGKTNEIAGKIGR